MQPKAMTNDSVRLSKKLLRELGRISARTKATTESIVADAVEHYLDELWKIEEIKKGIAAADRGDFASSEEVKAVFDKWTNRLKR